MANFGTIGYGTLEPGNGVLEEQISFTGVTQNGNGTATLTGVSTVLFVSPYTQTSGLAKTHAGSTTFIISNTAGFYNQLLAKNDDATITGIYTFATGATPAVTDAPVNNTDVANKLYVDTSVSAGAPNASTTVKGIGKVSVAPVSPTSPIFVGDNDPRVANPLTVAYGGTGLQTLTAHALQVGNGTSTPTQLGLGTTTTVLHGNASGDPSFAAVTLTTDVTGVLPVANGGTGSSTANGQWTLVSTQTISAVSLTTATNTQIATWTSLTGDTDDEYMIIYELASSATMGTSCIFGLTLNNDTGSHYYWNNLTFVASTAVTQSGGGTNVICRLGSALSGALLDVMSGTAIIKASKTIAGTTRLISSNLVSSAAGAASGLVSTLGSCGWGNTTDQITELDLYINQSSGGTVTISGKASLYKIVR